MARGDAYGYGPKDREWFERFDVHPVGVTDIQAKFEMDDSLHTVDLPSYLDEKLAPTADTGTILYRLVQLFGLPNVPGREAGGGAQNQERYETTWQYLFTVNYDSVVEAEDGPPESFLLSVYDYKTDASCGVAVWNNEGESIIADPVERLADVPDVSLAGGDKYWFGVAQLFLSMVEEPVPASYEGLWI